MKSNAHEFTWLCVHIPFGLTDHISQLSVGPPITERGSASGAVQPAWSQMYETTPTISPAKALAQQQNLRAEGIISPFLFFALSNARLWSSATTDRRTESL